MQWNIVTDSSCNQFYFENQNSEIRFSSISFMISIRTKAYTDNDMINVSEMITSMEECESASHTSCPSPYAWYEQFERPGYTIAITISSAFSGSYNSVYMARV